MTEPTAENLDRLRALVDSLGYDLDPSILIGGWATHLRVGGDISQEIDLIIMSPALRATLKECLDDYSENSRLSGGGTKARRSVDGVHIDAYFPHESKLGNRLLIDVAKLSAYTEEVRNRQWLMLTLEAHIATKLAALLDRPDSEKGEKDAREIVRLIDSGADGSEVVRILLDTTTGDRDLIPDHVRTAFQLLPDRARLNKKARRHYKNLEREWVDEATIQLRELSAPLRPRFPPQ